VGHDHFWVAAVAAVGHHLPPGKLILDAAAAVDDGVVAVAGLWVAQGDDQAGVRVDRDLQVRRVAVVLALRGGGDRGWGSGCRRRIVTWPFGRRCTGARASSGPRVSMTRWAAECDTPNSGPIWRMVRFVRQYTATSRTRSGRVSAQGRPGRPSAMLSPPRRATRRTSRWNCAGCRPVNGWINSGREAENTCTHR
jgi:hypothetical protein